VLATVFTGAGGYQSPSAFVAGLTPALWVGVAVLAFGALVALAVPFAPRVRQERPARRQRPDAGLAGDAA